MNALLAANDDMLGLAALQLFREGRDTADIAQRLGVPEARASQLVWLARCRARGLPAEWLSPDGTVGRAPGMSIAAKQEFRRASPSRSGGPAPEGEALAPPSTPPSGAPLTLNAGASR